MTNEWSGSRVTVFPVPEEVERNRRDFRVEVSAGGGDWIEVPVLAAKVAHRETIADLRFRDLDILEVNCNQPLYWGAMALTVGDENICRNILFEDIRVYDFAESSLLYVKVQKNGEYNPAPGFRIEGVTFRNIDYRGANQNPSCIAGYGPDRVVKDVTFENLCINGEKVLSAEQANLKIGPYAENVTFR